jgi:hypothetical protein
MWKRLFAGVRFFLVGGGLGLVPPISFITNLLIGTPLRAVLRGRCVMENPLTPFLPPLTPLRAVLRGLCVMENPCPSCALL